MDDGFTSIQICRPISYQIVKTLTKENQGLQNEYTRLRIYLVHFWVCGKKYTIEKRNTYVFIGTIASL